MRMKNLLGFAFIIIILEEASSITFFFLTTRCITHIHIQKYIHTLHYAWVAKWVGKGRRLGRRHASAHLDIWAPGFCLFPGGPGAIERERDSKVWRFFFLLVLVEIYGVKKMIPTFALMGGFYLIDLYLCIGV